MFEKKVFFLNIKGLFQLKPLNKVQFNKATWTYCNLRKYIYFYIFFHLIVTESLRVAKNIQNAVRTKMKLEFLAKVINSSCIWRLSQLTNSIPN